MICTARSASHRRPIPSRVIWLNNAGQPVFIARRAAAARRSFLFAYRFYIDIASQNVARLTNIRVARRALSGSQIYIRSPTLERGRAKCRQHVDIAASRARSMPVVIIR